MVVTHVSIWSLRSSDRYLDHAWKDTTHSNNIDRDKVALPLFNCPRYHQRFANNIGRTRQPPPVLIVLIVTNDLLTLNR